MTALFGDTRLPERFWSKVTVTPRSCWEMGNKPNAYGGFWLNGTSHRAHRLVWDRLVGPIGDGLDLDHLCRNKPCCNPAHLEPVTRSVNIRRGYTPDADIAKRTHCSKGHELTVDNVLDSKVPYKHCKTCHIDWLTMKIERDIDDDDWTWYDDE